MSSNGVGCSLCYEKMCAVPRSSFSLATSFPWQLSAGKNNDNSSMLSTNCFRNICGSRCTAQKKERTGSGKRRKGEFLENAGIPITICNYPKNLVY